MRTMKATDLDPDWRWHFWPVVHRCGVGCEPDFERQTWWINPLGCVLIPSSRRGR